MTPGGPIAISDINVENRYPWNQAFQFDDFWVRYLAAGGQAGHDQGRQNSAFGSPISISDLMNQSRYYPAGTLLSSYCLTTSDASYTHRDVYADGNGGSYVVDNIHDPRCGYTARTIVSQTCDFSIIDGFGHGRLVTNWSDGTVDRIFSDQCPYNASPPPQDIPG